MTACRKKLTVSVGASKPAAKPVFVSEFGADAKRGFHADALTRFSEEYQEDVYKRTLPSGKNPRVQRLHIVDFIATSARGGGAGHSGRWNIKGLISSHGEKKLAFNVLKSFL